MKNRTLGRATLLLALLLMTLTTGAEVRAAPQLEAPDVVLRGLPFSINVQELPGDGPYNAIIGDQRLSVSLDGQGGGIIENIQVDDASTTLTIVDPSGGVVAGLEIQAIFAWLSLLPALVAIVLALVFRQVIMALFVGILLGGWIWHGMDAAALASAFGDSVNVHVLEAASDSEHMSIVLFCLLIGGMVGIVSRNGGTQGIAQRISRVIRGRRQAQTSTFLLGIAIFFDDYANALIVGNTMRAITDKMAVSRAKLAYIIDSTAAPVSAIMLVSTWIGFQVGLISEAMSQISDWNESAYSVFVNAIPYNAYPILTLAFVLMTTWLGRDFGPMLSAERRAVAAGGRRTPLSNREAIVEEAEITTKPGVPIRAVNAIVPMLILAGITLGGIYTTGVAALGPGEHSLKDIFGEGDSFSSMMWGSLASCVVAVIMTQSQRLMRMTETNHYWFEGVKSMLLPITILMMAWALANVNETLQTSDFLVAALGDSLSPKWLPTAIFILAGFTAFATGSSWGVMGIMIPLVVPLAWAVLEQNGMSNTPEGMPILYASVASVLAGAVWGDHCSPLADTTLLSAMASGCDLVEHVRTQLPYAMLVGAVSLTFGTLAVGYGISWWLGLPIGAAVLLGVLLLVGRRPEKHPEAAHASAHSLN
ncbi:Na+/H+ antiporter NhaC family protein [Halomonas halocynthiae]|uniref:Na+/H+ antiporter NhaC family protein n=1 Tax=Halomonas halocynthiae TaxID=176290 RepID=UPI0004073B42|nr:Na+/H+ antiporter NhaC family protein [Halomonas halocynthiae]